MHKERQKFHRLAGQCLIELQRYKFKTNLVGCNLYDEDFNNYYDYFINKSNKRIDYTKGRINELNKTFEKNEKYLEGLELKSINNMLRNFRKRMDLLTNQPTDFNYAKFEKQQGELLESIVLDNHKMGKQIQTYYEKIKATNQKATQNLPLKFQQMRRQNVGVNFGKAFDCISKAQIRYYRYYETFERSIANMINQMNNQIMKLTEFFTMWENLGSSLIYELPSEREKIIENALEGRSQQTLESMKKKLTALPFESPMRHVLLKKIQQIQEKDVKDERRFDGTSTLDNKQKNSRGILRNRQFHLQKNTWFKTSCGAKVKLSKLPHLDFLLNDKSEKDYFRYTYEELYRQNFQYQQALKLNYYKKIQRIKQIQHELHDRNQYFQKKNFKSFKTVSNENRSPLQMQFSYSYDRSGGSYFCLLDFPMNLILRKIQFEVDRQSEMNMMDDKRRKQYDAKEGRVNEFDERKNRQHLGYRVIDESKEREHLKLNFCKEYHPQLLPEQKIQPPFDQLSSDSDHDLDENYRFLKSIPIDQIPQELKNNSQFDSLENRFHWFQPKPPIEVPAKTSSSSEYMFENLIKVYLPQYFKHISKQDDEYETLKCTYHYCRSLNEYRVKQQMQKQNNGIIFFISENFFIRLTPLIFRNGQKRFKVSAFVFQGCSESIKITIQEIIGCQTIIQIQDFSLSQSTKQAKQVIIAGTVIMFQEEKLGFDSMKKIDLKQAESRGRKIMEQYKSYIKSYEKKD